MDLSQSSPGSVLSTSRSNSGAVSMNEVCTPPDITEEFDTDRRGLVRI